MSRPQIKRPSPGTALGLLALIVALAGTANAGSTHVIVRKGDIAKGAVTANSFAKGAVTARALRKGAVTAAALANDSVSAAVLRSGAVTSAGLAPNAVTAKALANDSVTSAALRPGSVTSAGLAPNAVTTSAIAPGSIYGGALGPVALHATSIADLDESPAPGSWTASNTETATCGPGERLLTGGIVFTNPGNREVGVLESLPFSNETAAGIVGRITSNSAGTATAEVQAICLK